MQTWMIALIVVAGVIAFVAIAFTVWALVPVHVVLGRRKELTEKEKTAKGYYPDKFGVNVDWFKGVKCNTEKLSITAYDGVALSALLVKQSEGNGRVAICCHGYGATQYSMQTQAKLFYDRGFDVLIPAMRGHSGSGGKVGMAWIDRFDLLRWIDKTVGVFGDKVKIALCGTSMGGATVIAACGMTLPPQVKCVIDDCGFSSQYEEYAACLVGGKHIDKISAFHRFSLWVMSVGIKLVHGYSLYDADITTLARNMSVPALFIHGSADKFVPCELGRKLYDVCASENKEFYEVEGAGHALAYAADPQKYAEVFNAFVDKYVPGSSFIFDSNELIPVEEAPEEDAAPEENKESATEEQTDKQDDPAGEAEGEDKAETADAPEADGKDPEKVQEQDSDTAE